MQHIYLARHGQDQDNANGILNGHRDMPLTKIGLDQAKVLAETIKGYQLHITKIFSSPLQRAYVTAETVADALGLAKPEKLDLLIERNFGIMSGKQVKDIVATCGPDNILKADPITYFLTCENAESFPELLERAHKLLQWVKENVTDEKVLLVCHGDIGKMIYAAFYKMTWKEALLQFHFGNSEVMLLSEDAKLEDRHVHKVEQHNH